MEQLTAWDLVPRECIGEGARRLLDRVNHSIRVEGSLDLVREAIALACSREPEAMARARGYIADCSVCRRPCGGLMPGACIEARILLRAGGRSAVVWVEARPGMLAPLAMGIVSRSGICRVAERGPGC